LPLRSVNALAILLLERAGNAPDREIVYRWDDELMPCQGCGHDPQR